MQYRSTSIDPLSERDLHKEQLPLNAWIVRNGSGEVVQTCDALGVKRDFTREAISRRLMVRRMGAWTKPDDAAVYDDGTLFYRRGDVEIQEKLNGVHVHINQKTGVMIQTDHVNRCEIVRQSNGELWKRETDEDRELFEMWMNGKLSFRSQSYFKAMRCEAATPAGVQPLSYVVRLEESWSNGMLTRAKYCFRNPMNDQRDITLTVPIKGKLMTLKNVASVTTTLIAGVAEETVYELSGGTTLRVDVAGARRELNSIQRVRQFYVGGDQLLGFATTAGAEAVICVSH
ncbi:MAG TPA: hypothetical protein V6D22_06370 [Candidatus Obscuribacterales bacterium]